MGGYYFFKGVFFIWQVVEIVQEKMIDGYIFVFFGYIVQ